MTCLYIEIIIFIHLEGISIDHLAGERLKEKEMASRSSQATGAYLKVVLIGEPGVGKTALLDSYSNKKISKSVLFPQVHH